MNCPKCNKWPNENWDQASVAMTIGENTKLKAEVEHWKARAETMTAMNDNAASDCAVLRDRCERIKAENAKLKSMLREVAYSGVSDWTDHPAISYHEIQVEKSWIDEAQALLSGGDGETK